MHNCLPGQQEVAPPIAEYRSLQTLTQALARSIVKGVARSIVKGVAAPFAPPTRSHDCHPTIQLASLILYFSCHLPVCIVGALYL